MKRLLLIIFSTTAIAVFCATPTFAASDAQQNVIVEYCSSIKQVLRSIQREDSRDRVAVGAVYEILVSRYITPLNMRLVANNIGDPELISLQADFISAQSEFSTKFVEYSRSYERLLASDCVKDPNGFYERLKATRLLRAEVYALTQELNFSAASVSEYVYQLQGGLK